MYWAKTEENRYALMDGQQRMMDDDVTNKKGICAYLLSGEEKYLDLRAFTESQKRAACERQDELCPVCKQHFAFEEMRADHITAWSKGGHATPDNCQLLCRDCNLKKGAQ